MSRIEDDPVTSLTFCWRLERTDGGGAALTSHDTPIRIGDDEFLPNPGMAPAAITQRLGLEPTSTEIAGSLASDVLSGDDLTLGRWDGARVTLLAVDWREPGAEPMELVRGELAEVTARGDGFIAELRGAAWKLNEPVCPSTSPHCRAQFGDRACRVDLAGRSRRVSVAASDGTEIVIREAADTAFAFGRLRYLSGPNCGMETVILSVDGATLRIRDLPRRPLEPETVIEIREGCDKRLETCAARFNNAANFRGEPHLPGMDLLTRYPGA